MIAYSFLIVLIWLLRCALMGISQFIYDYQTLITGATALGAAYVAVRPVYAQLALMRTQSNAVMRDMLLQREAELRQAAAAINKHVGERLSDLGREYPWYEEDEDIRLTETQAHHYEQHISSAVTWLRLGYRWRDNPIVEGKRTVLTAKLDELIGKLGEIYFTAAHQQHDDDHSIDDAEWERLERRGEEAKTEIYPALAAAKAAMTDVLDAGGAELKAIDEQLRELDRALVRSRI